MKPGILPPMMEDRLCILKRCLFWHKGIFTIFYFSLNFPLFSLHICKVLLPHWWLGLDWGNLLSKLLPNYGYAGMVITVLYQYLYNSMLLWASGICSLSLFMLEQKSNNKMKEQAEAVPSSEPALLAHIPNVHLKILSVFIMQFI